MGHLGLSTVQKCIVELQMLAYGIATNATNEYCHMDERIMTKCFKCFVKEIFGKKKWQLLKVKLRKKST